MELWSPLPYPQHRAILRPRGRKEWVTQASHAGYRFPPVTHRAPSAPSPNFKRHWEITRSSPGGRGQLGVNSSQEGAGAGGPAWLSLSLIQAAQHSKSLEKPSVSRSWGWQELNVPPHPQRLLFRLFTRKAKSECAPPSGSRLSGQEGP